ncbi:MAG: sugar ABC transporter substrate-binding protein [Hyphomicrobiaceae bacterium]|nr:sugar ABC transporter substrate-binding protein [Hyphomicrobiaceae bacterium]
MHRNVKRIVLAAAFLAAGTAATLADELSGEITVWDWNYETETWGKALKQVDAEFLAMHPGVTIKHVAQPHANYYQLWQTANATQSGPDVMQMHAGTFGVLTYPESLEPLNDYITPEMRASIKGWEAVAANFDADGTIYGVPGNFSGWVFYYNKALFAQAGISEAPKTYDELLADCEKLKAAGILPFALGNQDALGTLQYLNILFPGNFNEADSVRLVSGDLKYNGDEFKRVNQHLLDLIDAGYFDPGFSSMLQWTDAVDSFASGESAMIAGIASDTVSYNEFLPSLGDDLGVFYAPADTVSDPYIPDSSGPVWVMTNYSHNKDAAWAYIEFMTGPRGAQIQYEVAGVLPINTAYQLPDDAPEFVKGMVGDFLDHPTFLYVSSLMRQDVVFEWMRLFQDVIAGSLTLDEALNQLQDLQDNPK